MRPSLAHVFEQAISKPRLDSYRGYFQTKGLDEAIGLYMWNSEISLCFGALLSFFEIALRNNIHRAMSLFYTRGVSSSAHWYDQIRSSLKYGTIAKIDEVRYTGYGTNRVLRNPQPSPDEIVSRVSFGFWPGVLSTVDTRYADQILQNVFPNHPLNIHPQDWKTKSIRKNALAFIYELNDFRNRLAHHEPLWKFPAIKDTSVTPPIEISPETKCYAESLVRFQRLLGLFDAALLSMDQAFQADINNSSWRKKLDFLLSARGMSRYKAMKHSPATNHITPSVFRKNFPFIVSNSQPVRIVRSSKSGLFTPD